MAQNCWSSYSTHSFAVFVSYGIYISYSGKLLALRQCKKLRKSVRVVGADLTIIIIIIVVVVLRRSPHLGQRGVYDDTDSEKETHAIKPSPQKCALHFLDRLRKTTE
jgi:hypothetical protein